MTESTDSDRNSDVTATLGRRLASAREARGMTQTSLAMRLGVAQRTVERWEGDAAEPRANKVQMMSGILDVSIPWLLTGEGRGAAALEGPGPMPDSAGLLGEIRLLRAQMLSSAERLARLERQLCRSVPEAAGQ